MSRAQGPQRLRPQGKSLDFLFPRMGGLAATPLRPIMRPWQRNKFSRPEPFNRARTTAPWSQRRSVLLSQAVSLFYNAP